MKKIILNSEKSIELINKSAEEKTLEKVKIIGKLVNNSVDIKCMAVINNVKYYSTLEDEEFLMKDELLETYINYLENTPEELDLKMVSSIFENGEVPHFKICLA